MEKKFKEFGPTSWAIDNKTSIYVLAVIIAIFGIFSYRTIPKEQIPDIVIPYIIVNTVYPGTSPADIENLITRPLETNLKSISGVKVINSTSVQDFSSIVVEFRTGVAIPDAKQKVKDAVDKSKKDLPTDLKSDPDVRDIDLSEIPIMYINISGDYGLDKLKKYADMLEDKIEELPEITRVDIVGALSREIQVNLDMFKLQATGLTITDISRMISAENVTISGGNIEMQGMDRSLRVVGEFQNLETLKNLVIKSATGASVYLKDVAEIKDTYATQESYARLDGKNVITVNVIKKSGQNLLDASDKIKVIISDLQKNKFPTDLKVTLTGEQSKFTRTTLTDLNNTIIIGFILVTMVLMFFMGFTNAVFVALSVPLSMALAYIILPGIGFTMNMLVMFSFIFALGIVVDDAIVVIENTHRIFRKTNMDIANSAKFAAGEVFVPILSGTLTTLAPFFPLAFWPGVTGKFMFFIPVTVIITLFMSLLVAYILNPVFAVSFMKPNEEEIQTLSNKRIFTTGGIIIGLGAVLHMASYPALANLTIFLGAFYLFHNFYGFKVLLHFQHAVIPQTLRKYEQLLEWILKKRRPYYLLLSLIFSLFFTFFLLGLTNPKVVFFPDNDPNSIFALVKMPVGTNVSVTDSVTRVVEGRIMKVLEDQPKVVESVITNVALGASDSQFEGGITTSNKGKVTVNFVEFAKRKGVKTEPFINMFREAVKDIPGATVTVGKQAMGPPVGKPINIEMTGDDLDELVLTTNRFKRYIDSLNIGGIEELKTDFDVTKPEILIEIDRIRANREGLSTGQIGQELRFAIFGLESTKLREAEDQYPIMIRYQEDQRKNIDRLMNSKITYRDMNTGLIRQIPLSAVCNVSYPNSYGGINRKDAKRIINIYSNVISGFNANEIIGKINKAIPGFEKSERVDIKITGEQENQKESSDFLGRAMFLALCLIMFILITQFNSLSKPIIIITEVIFSIIGVLLGFIITGMPISITMTGMGVVALAGIVVRNGILLVEFTDKLIEKGHETREAIIEAGKTRITPVMLTATAAILGLLPLAIGFNIDFVGLFTNFHPHIHFGGDNVMFFGPLSWTIIFGLTFATFLTLIFIPVMYYIMYKGKAYVKRKSKELKLKKADFKDLV
ncbi:MAG: efflux RND transporter permease subunit [Bacteroidales bacterium]|nr:efflux RND transporter permease subunit [Bacteroidales bacterium]MCB9013715.1 efflux RND transporter permease subunit [Bacteroidales bacterium]